MTSFPSPALRRLLATLVALAFLGSAAVAQVTLRIAEHPGPHVAPR